jgi:ABC-type multidrug transport system ATPase subunit
MRLFCHNISFRYPNAENDVFRNLSYRVSAPGFNALFGPSGVGKTSFARIISGDIKNFSGEISTDGIARIAYSYNLERLPGWSCVGTHIDKNIPPAQKRLKDELIDVFGLENCIHLRFSQLSMGQKNRINLLRYLLEGFDLLIMDESLANVDEQTREVIILKIKEIFPETLFLYISHNVIEVSKFCKDILVFRGQKKSPLMVRGQNLKAGHALNQSALDKTMLEIMNAS